MWLRVDAVWDRAGAQRGTAQGRSMRLRVDAVRGREGAQHAAA